MNRKYQIISVLVVVILIAFEQVLQLDSIVKQGFKIVLLVIIPIIVIYQMKKTTFGKEFNINNVTFKDLKIPLIIGVTIYLLTLIGYVLFMPLIDPDLVVDGLNGSGITTKNIILASIYLCFINSFLEEFFFRGFMFSEFSKISNKWGYIVSSAFFSIYHVLVMFTLFDWIMGVISIIGLMIVGMILAYMNQTNKSIINSWVVHIFADLGVVTIGLYLFFR